MPTEYTLLVLILIFIGIGVIIGLLYGIVKTLLANNLKINQMSKTLEEVQAQVTDLTANIDGLKTKADTAGQKLDTIIQDLLAKIAAGAGATGDQLQAISDQIADAKSHLDQIVIKDGSTDVPPVS